MSHSPQHAPRILKVGGIQAARFSETQALILKFRENGPLSVVLSAPNTNDFRTTNVLIAAAEYLADGDGEKAKAQLHAVRDFVCELLRKEVALAPCFSSLFLEIQALFESYNGLIDHYLQRRSPSARLFTLPPNESNDYVGQVLRRATQSHRSISRPHSILPFLELGENLSAIIYTHLTQGIPVTSRSWMHEEIGTVRNRVRSQHDLIISGALRMGPREKMLALFGRGYTDASAGRLATRADAALLVHKEFPVCTADPKIVNGASRPLPQASLSAIRASFHPFVGAQFLNRHVFTEGEPGDIQVGDFTSSMVTHVVDRDIPDAFPLIQKGPRLTRTDSQPNFGDISLSVGNGEECLVAVIDHAPRGLERLQQVRAILKTENLVASLNDRITSVLAPQESADDVVRLLHARLCGA